MNKRILVLALVCAPVAALAHKGGALRLGVSETHVGMASASANMPGLQIGVGGMYHGVDIRAGVSYARGAGASLETFGVRATANPRAALSPYASLGMIDLADLSGATTTTNYQVNAGGLITPTTTTTDLPVRGVVMGYGLVGLRARLDLNPRWSLAAHAGIGAGFGGSTTGLPAVGGGRSPFATSVGASLQYRVTPHAVAALTYTREVIPVRGATFRREGVALTMARTF